ncbi:MAG: carboxypeptidase regulatory-like domain-containing protein [Deltaproteobacteria bacterium]|nr:carboxypeptidase regulatory-like domain-containing protein [Deltaproteobacteria bacterium]
MKRGAALSTAAALCAFCALCRPQSDARAATLSGQVVAAESGAGVGPATVQIVNSALGGVELDSALDGSFRVEGLPAGRYRVRAVPSWRDDRAVRWHPSAVDFCAATAIDIAEDDVIEGVEVALPTGGRLQVQVLRPDGAPLEGATIWARPAEDSSGQYDRPALTGADGRATVVGIDLEAPAGEWTVTVSSEDLPQQLLGGTYDPAQALRFPAPTAAGVDAGTHQLLAGIRVSGTIFGPGGPASGGTAHVYSSSQVRSVPIGADGSYAARGLPPGEVIVWANVEGLAQTYYPDSDRPGERVPVADEGGFAEGVDLHAPREAVFFARFTDAETGAPIPEVGGLLYNDSNTVGIGDAGQPDGTLRIDRLHGGDWRLFAWAEDEGYTDDWVRESDGAERVFPIEPGVESPVFELALRLAAGGAGLVRDDRGQPAAVQVILVREDGLTVDDLTDATGAWEVDGLGAGSWSLRAEPVALCPGDPAVVPWYWPGTPNPDWAGRFTIGEGEQAPPITLVAPVDLDQDLMADQWEEEHGLNPALDDAAEDPDGDQYSNLDEYRLGTDPQSTTPVKTGCGCGGGAPGSAVGALLALALTTRRRRR